ncbi:MAG: metallophosphoesterase [Pseudomonadota bacterium]
MITRRQVLKGAAALGLAGFATGGYAFAIEPNRLAVTRYKLTPPQWRNGPDVRIVAIADLHTCKPWMTADRVGSIARRVNALKPDVVVLLGDYTASHRFITGAVPHDDWAAALSDLSAPLGVFAILGNHDWWERFEWQRTRRGPTLSGEALRRAGIPVLENTSVQLAKDKRAFWLSGLGDQWAFWLTEQRQRHRGNSGTRFMPDGTFGFEGRDDLPTTLSTLKDDAPAILLAHEPDIFPQVPARYALTMSGHTHGGQVQFMGWAPKVPSIYGSRYVYGRVTEADDKGVDRDLIVSCGLGCSGLPIRFGRPPELTVVDIASPSGQKAARS